MSHIEEIVKFNRSFVENNQHESYISTKYPNKKVAILSCMDTRLTELLPAALNLKNGDAKIIKNAGGIITHPFGSVMLSLLVSIYELDVEEIMVIGHYDCGMEGLEADKMIQKMLDRKISQEKLDMIKYCGIDIKKWLKGFDDVGTSVLDNVNIIKNHPLVPEDVTVCGFIMDPKTGKLTAV